MIHGGKEIVRSLQASLNKGLLFTGNKVGKQINKIMADYPEKIPL